MTNLRITGAIGGNYRCEDCGVSVSVSRDDDLPIAGGGARTRSVGERLFGTTGITDEPEGNDGQ